jgi:signal transduction histidine kinase
MGMGLPISRTIIEAHNGRIWAENNGSGRVSFHAARRGRGSGEINVNESIVQIVDDDPYFLAVTARLLRASGFTVRTYSSASEFLA